MFFKVRNFFKVRCHNSCILNCFAITFLRNKKFSNVLLLLSSITNHYLKHTIRMSNVSMNLGPSNGFTPRFLGFALYVSNTTNKSDGTLCFKDNYFNLSTMPADFSTICTVHGQYVIYYNERLPNVAYPDGYSTYAFNELCEVQVFGKYVHEFSSLELMLIGGLLI